MACPACGAETIVAPVPDARREDAPDDADAISLCTTCLTVQPSDDEPPDDPDFSQVSEAFPMRLDPAVTLALIVHHCDSLATNRTTLESLLEAVERAGVDPLLTIDRLLDDPSIEPAVDLERRRHQLEDLLY